ETIEIVDAAKKGHDEFLKAGTKNFEIAMNKPQQAPGTDSNENWESHLTTFGK
ncbi:hypothetical protein PIB30_025508, partial [Stylosanthes scabra]|nr:hypothetical protein [Stylosanthes scabra]